MKKQYFLLSLLAAGTLLASCGGGDTTCSSCPSATTPEPEVVVVTNFAEQLKAAGITGYTYEDPNAAYYTYEELPTDGDYDLEVGASSGHESASTTSHSYYTFDFAMSRINTYWQNYNWKEAEDEEVGTGAKTLAEAAKLTNAKYVSEIFPNDGKEYVIENTRGWCYASTSFATVDADGSPRISEAIPSASKGEDGTWNINLFSAPKTLNENLVRTGECMLLLYEYHQDEGYCNGGRIVCEVDFEATTLSAGGESTKLNKGDTLPESYSYVRFVLKATNLYSMGYVDPSLVNE